MKLNKELLKKILYYAMWFFIGVLITKVDIDKVIDFFRNLFN